jgi:hypothetical protein
VRQKERKKKQKITRNQVKETKKGGASSPYFLLVSIFGSAPDRRLLQNASLLPDFSYFHSLFPPIFLSLFLSLSLLYLNIYDSNERLGKYRVSKACKPKRRFREHMRCEGPSPPVSTQNFTRKRGGAVRKEGSIFVSQNKRTSSLRLKMTPLLLVR